MQRDRHICFERHVDGELGLTVVEELLSHSVSISVNDGTRRGECGYQPNRNE